MAGTVLAIQANGERISIELWVYNMYKTGCLTDPDLLRPIKNAVSIVLTPGYPSFLTKEA